MGRWSSLRTRQLLWAGGALIVAAAAIILLSPNASAWTGGPDGCGYTGLDSTAIGGPAYNFVDIDPAVAGGGTGLNQGDDTSIDVNIPFTFTFCGVGYTTIRTSSNGYVCFGTTASNCGPGNGGGGAPYYPSSPAPQTYYPYPAVYGYMIDLYPPGYGSATACAGGGTTCTFWSVSGIAPNRVFIYEEKNVPIYGNYVGATFEIKLLESSNCAEVHYQSVRDGSGTHPSLAGIAESGVDALVYEQLYGPGSTFASTAVKYCQTTTPPPRCSPATQTRNIGQAANFNVINGVAPFSWSAPSGSPPSGSGTTFSTTYTASGTYTVTVTDSASPPASSNCTVTVPQPTCSPSFQTRNVGAPAFFSVIGGLAPFTWSAPSGSPSSGAGSSFSTSYSASGTYTVTVTDSQSPPRSANCTVNVPPPSCSPLTLNLAIGQTGSLFASGGTGTYTWSAPSGTPATGSGSFFSVRYTTAGTFTITLSSGTQTATCRAVVVAPACGYGVDTAAPYNFTDIDPGTGGGGAGLGTNWMWNFYYYGQTFSVHPNPPMNFQFCGSTYPTFWLSGSGIICLDPSTTQATGTYAYSTPVGCGNYYGQPIPSLSAPNAAVYGLQASYYSYYGCNGSTGMYSMDQCVFYKVEGAAPKRVLIYEFKGVGAYFNYNALETFQIKLYEETSCIEVHFKDVRATTGYPYYATASGFENAAGSSGYQHFYAPGGTNLPATLSGTAWASCPFMASTDRVTFNEDQVAQSFNVSVNDVYGTEGFSPIVASTLPTKGTLTGPVNGIFTYRPFADQNGVDQFTYTIRSASGRTSTAKVFLTINAVNDAPVFVPNSPTVMTSPDLGTFDGNVASGVAPGPATATDESSQTIVFDLISYTNPSLFRAPPVLRRTAAVDSNIPVVPPTSGAFAALRFLPTGISGTSRVCFRAHDGGGTATVTTVGLTPARTATGVNLGALTCFDVVENGPPVAYFETDSGKAEPGEAITFDSCPRAIPACSYDLDGTIVGWTWDFGDGSTGRGAKPVHAYSSPGAYLVRLRVEDNSGYYGLFTRTIGVGVETGIVAPEGNNALPPLADAGENLTVFEGDLVRLVGSYRGGNTPATYQWTQFNTPETVMQNATAPTMSFVAPQLADGKENVLLFSLRVAQGALMSQPDYVLVTVRSHNRLPDVKAGGTFTATADTVVRLIGAQTADADQDPLTFRWEQVEGPPVTIDAATAANATFTAPHEPTILKFRLIANDGSGSNQDIAVVYVQPAEAPAVGAGMTYVVTAAPGGADVKFVAVGLPDAESATWEFGDGTPAATGATVTHRYAAGKYDATMHVGENTYPQHLDIAAAQTGTKVKAGPDLVLWASVAAAWVSLAGIAVAVVMRHTGKGPK